MMADTKPLDLYGLRRREVQAIGAAISTRDWWALEQAYNSIRDKLDHAGYSIGSVPPTPKGGLPGRGEVERTEWFVIRRHGAFFRPDAAGYTTHIGSAGFYTREQADKYADVEGVTIGKLTDWQAEALAVINGADRLRAALAPAEAIRDGGEGGEG